MVWVEPVATSKLLGCPHSPHQRGFCTEGLLNWHALDMLGRTWNVCMDMHNTASKSMLQNGSMSKYKLRMLCCAWWSLLPVCISLNTLWSLSIFVVHIRSTKNLRIRIVWRGIENLYSCVCGTLITVSFHYIDVLSISLSPLNIVCQSLL